MIKFCKNIRDNSNFISQYIPLITFKAQKQRRNVDEYIVNEAKHFFSSLELNINVEKNFIGCDNLVTDKEFNEVDIQYFYENILSNIKRNAEGKLEHQPKWGVTFDQKCAPIEKLAYVSPNYTGNNPIYGPKGESVRRFGTFDINGQPIFYYLYFTIQEILDAIRDSDEKC